MRPVVIALLTLLLALPGYGFEADKHVPFSNDALAVYRTRTGRVLSEEAARAFADGSHDEDDLGITRLTNWHFYNNGNRIGRYWYFLPAEGSNKCIFRREVSAMEELLGRGGAKKDLYAIAGRVAHHIQDMSSPPHVMPIFHMMFDRIDTYPAPPVDIGDPALICKDVRASFAGPYDLLENAAQRTLGAVGEKVVFRSGGPRAGETWMKFWGGPEDRDYKGFRTYGEYGNRFGLLPPCKTTDCPPYDKDVFTAFYGDCHRRAVADTVRLLLYLDRREAGLTLPADGAAAMYHSFSCGNQSSFRFPLSTSYKLKEY